MKNSSSTKSIIFVFLAALVGFAIGYYVHVVVVGGQEQYLFTLSGTSGSSDAQSLTLEGVSDVTLFSNHPERNVGQMSLQEFAQLWQGDGSFRTDPPNVALTTLTEDTTTNSVLEVSDPVVTDDSITFTTIVLAGQAPAAFGAATLFVDPDTVSPIITDAVQQTLTDSESAFPDPVNPQVTD